MIVRVPFLIPTGARAQVLLPGVIFLRRNVPPTVELIAHELVHVDQLARLGLVRYWFTYLWLLARHGYWDNELEREARRAETDPEYLVRARDLLGG